MEPELFLSILNRLKTLEHFAGHLEKLSPIIANYERRNPKTGTADEDR
jgi:hypothetical protein